MTEVNFDSAAALLQLFARDKVVVHVEFSLPPEQYGKSVAEFWQTIHVDPDLSIDERVTVQREATEKLQATAEDAVWQSVQRHMERKIAFEKLQQELASERGKAARARTEAMKAEREADKQVAALAQERHRSAKVDKDEIPF